MFSLKRIAGFTGILLVVMVMAALRQEDRLETEIIIEAPPQKVWQVLTDFPSYPDWNPFIRGIGGELREGGVLQVKIDLTNEDPAAPIGGMMFEPRVLVASQNNELRWYGELLLPRVFDGEHWFLLEPVEGGTRLRHGEDFSGLLIMFVDWQETSAAFQRMNQALKKRVENKP